MKRNSKKPISKPRNWALVLIASTVIVLNIAMVYLGITYMSTLGWWSPVLIIGGVSSMAMAVIAIKQNDPTWLLLDLILPN
jgi:nicotinamide riboside transporter PnuC